MPTKPPRISVSRAPRASRPAWDHGGKTRQQRGYGAEHQAMRKLLMKTVVTCQECARKGRTTIGTIADHIVPLAKGGTGERSNYQLLCKDCDREKQARDQGKRPRRKKVCIGLDGWPCDD